MCTPVVSQPVPERLRLDVDESVEVRLTEVVTSLLCGNELLYASYFRVVLVVVCIVKMCGQVARRYDFGEEC